MSDYAIPRLEAALRNAGADLEPPHGWESRVLAAIAVRRRRPWWHFAAPALVAVAAVMIYMSRPRGSSPAVGPLKLSIDVEHEGPTVRGTTAHIGDVVHIGASGGAAYHAIWIYRDHGGIVLVCADDAPCDFHVTTFGDYQIVALSADTALPSPHATLDADVAAAAAAHAQYKIEELKVR